MNLDFEKKQIIPPENWQEILAKNIETERLRLGLTQEQLSKLVGSKKEKETGARVSAWERDDDKFFNVNVLHILCLIFGRTPTELMWEDLAYKPIGGKSTLLSMTDDEMIAYGGASRKKATESPPAYNEEKLLKLRVLEKVMQQMEELEKT